MEKLGVAILGLDHWYSAFPLAQAAAAGTHTQLVAIAHDDAARARQAAQDYGAALATADYRAALDRPDVDIVVALYSTDRNVELCREAAALGKHIISVKPMALDLAGADAIVAAVRTAGVHFFPLDSLYRLNPSRQQLKRWLGEGRIGQPLRYTQMLYSSLPQAWPGSQESGWWVEAGRVPGGAWLDHAIYAVDTARWLFGSEPVQVQGVAGKQRYADLAFEDYGLATYTLANGVVALIEDTWTAERGFGFSRNEVIGSAGSICEDTNARGTIALRGDFGFKGLLHADPPRDAGSSALDHMVAVLRGETAPAATVEDGRANLAACLAFYQAAQAGTTLALPA